MRGSPKSRPALMPRRGAPSKPTLSSMTSTKVIRNTQSPPMPRWMSTRPPSISIMTNTSRNLTKRGFYTPSTVPFNPPVPFVHPPRKRTTTTSPPLSALSSSLLVGLSPILFLLTSFQKSLASGHTTSSRMTINSTPPPQLTTTDASPASSLHRPSNPRTSLLLLTPIMHFVLTKVLTRHRDLMNPKTTSSVTSPSHSVLPPPPFPLRPR